MRQAPTSAPDDTAAPDILENLEDFELHLKARNRSPMTIKSYREAVRQFDAFVADRGMPRAVSAIRREHIEAFVADQLARLRPASAANRYRSLAQFWRFMRDEGLVTVSPMVNMSPPSVPLDPPPVVREEEQDALLKVTAGTGYLARRDRALVRLLFDSGMRLSELGNLHVGDVDRQLAVAHVVGKGSKRRVAPFDWPAAEDLRRYLKARTAYLAAHPHLPTDALWIGKKGAMGPGGVAQALKRRAAEAGLVGFHAHLGRHTAAHEFLAAGGSEVDLMRLMGWSSRQMVARYGASAADERALAAYRSLKDRTRR